jgi:hypothetical protein
MYLVVRSLKHNNTKIDYVIQKGDIIKLGRIKFAAKEIAIVDTTSMEVDEGGKAIKHGNVESVDDEEFFEFEEVESHWQQFTEEELTESSDKSQIPHCKFCWMPGTSSEDPLLCICKCAGSVGYIHYNCLKRWLDNKKTVKEGDNYQSIFWKSFECEICKKAYPLMIKSNGQNYHLVDYSRPTTSYLVLESLNQDKNT